MKKPNESTTKDQDFENLVNLLSVYSEASNRLEALEAETNEQQLELVDGVRKDYAELQHKLQDTSVALEVLARKHLEWFAKKATINTPYGQVKLAENPPALEAPNEELSIVLLRLEEEKTQGQFRAAAYIRSEERLNLDALKTLDDETLSRFRMRRRKSDTFSVKPARLDLGKAVEKAASKEAA